MVAGILKGVPARIHSKSCALISINIFGAAVEIRQSVTVKLGAEVTCWTHQLILKASFYFECPLCGLQWFWDSAQIRQSR